MFLYFFISGRALILLFIKFISKSRTIPNTILETKNFITYPIFGLIYTGNILVLLNFFIPLKSSAVKIILFLILLPNLLNFQIDINLIKKLSFNNLIYFVLIPSVLLISTSDINFHYDASYYHLNTQNWLRESNLIIGFVNIFWPFGISSIYEYLSAILWFQDSLIQLHFLSLLFIHFFYSFIFYHIFSSKNMFFKNGSILLIIFSIFDNFGLSGGRNGFIYIQAIGKQDIEIGILVVLVTLITTYQFKKETVNELDLVCLSFLVLFIVQIKLSGIYILFIFFLYIFFILIKKRKNIKQILFYHTPAIIFSFIWIIKNYLMTGCLIFPVSLTCINKFEWYIKGTTEKIELYNANTSFGYFQYLINPNQNFYDWATNFLNSNKYNTFSNFYRSVYTNFTFSYLAIIFIFLILFKKKKNNNKFNLIIIFNFILTFIYLILFGPIPRYTVGFLCSIIIILGFYTTDLKYKLSKTLLFFIFFASLILLPRFNSYINFIENKNIALSEPRFSTNENIDFTKIQWVEPQFADRCWINLSCRFEEGTLSISKIGIFYVVKRIEVLK